MRNIERKYVDALEAMANKIKACDTLYANARAAFDINVDYYDGQSIRDAITTKAEEVLSDIDQMLCELYNDWSGKNDLNPSDFEDARAFEDALEKIDNDNMDVADVCAYFIACDGYVEWAACFIPVNFMEEFIDEYGIFTIDRTTCNVEVK